MKNTVPGRVDRLDAKILAALQENGKITMQRLSEHVGLSPTACVNRIKRLESDGLISGYHARIDHSRAGLSICAMVLIKVSNNTTETAKKFQRAVDRSQDIYECHMTAGSLDYVAKIYARDFQHYEQIVRNEIANLPGLASMESVFLFGDLVDTPTITF